MLGMGKDRSEESEDPSAGTAPSKGLAHSPRRLVALSLEAGGDAFTSKLKTKLEESGGVACRIQVAKRKLDQDSAAGASSSATEGSTGANTTNFATVSAASSRDHPFSHVLLGGPRGVHGSTAHGDVEGGSSGKPKRARAKKRRRKDLHVAIDASDNFGETLGSGNVMAPPSARLPSATSVTSPLLPVTGASETPR